MARLGRLVGLAALSVAVLPAAAGGNAWGTWTFTGHGTTWSGTLVDAHGITGVLMGVKARVRYNSVTSFTVAGKKCSVGSQLGTGACYHVTIPAQRKVKWKLTLRTRIPTSAKLLPCIKYSGAFHCRPNR
jgi:hypothetical protein